MRGAAWRRARYSPSWGKAAARSCCFWSAAEKEFIHFSFLSITLLVTLSRVQFLPFMRSGSVFFPSGLLVCGGRSGTAAFGRRANNVGSRGKCLLCASYYLAWHHEGGQLWAWERTSLRILIFEKSFSFIFHCHETQLLKNLTNEWATLPFLVYFTTREENVGSRNESKQGGREKIYES